MIQSSCKCGESLTYSSSCFNIFVSERDLRRCIQVTTGSTLPDLLIPLQRVVLTQIIVQTSSEDEYVVEKWVRYVKVISNYVYQVLSTYICEVVANFQCVTAHDRSFTLECVGHNYSTTK